MSDAVPGYDPISAEDLSGFNDYVGLRIVEWRDGFVRLELRPEAHHLNRSGAFHGGVTSTLIDVAGGHSGVYLAIPGRIRRCVTLSLSVNFIGRASAGSPVYCTGTRRGGGRSIFMADCEVRDGTGVLVATGHGVYRHIGEFEIGTVPAPSA